MEEYQTHNFWVPNTPEKSNSTKLQSICKDSGNSTNSGELENGFHNWEAALMGKPLPDTSAAKLGDPNSTNNPSDSIFRTGFEGTRFETNPSVENKFISVGQNMWINSNYLPSTPNGESTPPKHVLDLNTPFQELIEAVSNVNSSSLFAPITPDQSKKIENNQACSTETINNQLTKDSSCDVASTQVVEKTPISKPRRKKHRPKVIKEGKPKRTRKLATPKPDEREKNPRGERKYVTENESDKIQSLPEAKETPKVKRKYVRKKIIDKTTEFVIGEALKECNDAKKESKFRERKSCKKRLNFDENSSSVEESSSCRPMPNENNFNVGETKSDRVREVEIQEQNESKKGKSRIVFSEKPHDKEEIIVENIMDNNTRPAPSLNNSNFSTVTSLREREEVKEAKGLKMGSESNINEEKQICTNVIEDHYKSSSNNVPLFPYVYDGNRKSEMYFSNIDENKQAKQRRRGGKEATNYTFNDTYIASYLPPQTNYGYHAQYYPNGYQAPTVYLNAHLQQQALEYHMILEHAKMMKEMVGNRGCSQVSCYVAKGTSQCGDLQLCKSVNNSQTKVEIKVGKASKMGKNRRKIAGVARKKKPTVDDITEYLKYLEIDPTCNEKNKEKNALVLYKGVGTIVPFQGPFKPIKKRRERAKVDLDAETSKVWRLLLENINNEGIDGTDEEKAKWWENERRVFQGRADSFIARMHLVQGDRRFTPWKGSVVDSVVGVFLTQNVSDHASSSAFMSMAAHFPIKIRDSFEPSSTEANIFVKEQKIQIHEPNSTFRSSNSNGSYTTFTELLQMAESKRGIHKSVSSYTENIQKFMYNQNIPENPSSRISNGSDENCASEQSEITVESGSQDTVQKILNINFQSETVTRIIDNNKQVGSSMIDPGSTPDTSVATSEPNKGKNRNQNRNQNHKQVDWDMLRLRAQEKGKREKTDKTMDSLDWEAVWRADVDEVADTIKARGMNNILAERIQAFLNRLVTEHGSIDLEWLRDVPPDKAKEYLLSIRGLGLKSVECVRLLTLHHLAFPVDTNVGRIAVRLGWVPLQPLPESLQLHLLELYPVLESIQQYLWPRLCKLDQKTLYELHYQMITFGKVFCTKSKPNCNACPMRGECRHFASAFASARLALPGPEEKRIVNTTENKEFKQKTGETIEPYQLQLPEPKPGLEILAQPQKFMSQPIIEEPIIEVPNTPEPEAQLLESDIEDYFPEDSEEIPTIRLNIKKFSQTLQNYMEGNMELQEDDMSKALVALSQEAASIPMPKLKNVNQLRTEHQVYELPDSHPLLEGLDIREPDDPCSYLLAIWTPGETANSVEQPENRCSSQDSGNLCEAETCFSCNSVREANSQTVRGTLLIPCRTATRGSFPLNGTYFQVNEVFADHASSLNPIDVPRSWIWNLPRRVVYFGTSIPTIFKGLSTETIQYCFWRGFVCVRGFDQKTRAPRPLMARLHFPASKLSKPSGKTDDKKI